MVRFNSRAVLWRQYIKLSNNPIIKWKNATNKNLKQAITKIVIEELESKQKQKQNKQIRFEKKETKKKVKQNKTFNKKVNTFFNKPKDNESIKITFDELKNNLNKVKFHNKYNLSLKYNNTYKFLNNFDQLNNLENAFQPSQINQNYSDADVLYESTHHPNSIIKLKWILKHKERKAGAYFNYFNLTNIDLSKYQIYQKDQQQSKLNCLQQALTNGGLNNDKFTSMISEYINENDELNLCKSDKIPTSKLTKISEKLDIQIILYHEHLTRKESKTYHFNKTSKNIHEICLLNNHYFIYEKDTKISKYQFTNNRFDKRTIFSSYKLVKFLLDNKDQYLELITLENSKNIKYHTEDIKQYINLSINENDYKKIINKPINKISKYLTEDYDIIYFDFESTTDEEYHNAFMISASYRNSNEIKTYEGKFSALNFLKSINKNSLLIAHNLKYDLQFVINYLCNITNYIPSGNKCKCLSGSFFNIDTNKNYKLYFKDSYSFISEPLSKFGKMFNLTQHKEIMPYESYNSESINKSQIKISEALEYLKEDQKEQFLNNIKELNLINATVNVATFTKQERALAVANGSYFDHIKYAKFYCEKDVEVLKLGYEQFRNDCLLAFELDIDDFISMPQYAEKYMINMGAYDECYKLSSQVREFIKRSIVGGRCMTNNNEKYHIKEKLNDFDAVSLYPSAMKRLGYLKGIPKVLSNEDIINFDINKYDGFFIEIEILNIKKNRQFPLISKKNDDGIRIFSNEIRGKNIYIDKFGLEDLIKFQNIEYKILRGYYFNEGRNYKIQEIIQNLFETRKKYKKENNQIQNVYKLMMNSAYGKTIAKPIKYEYKFVNGKDNFIKKMKYNIATIEEAIKISNSLYMIKSNKIINNHFSMPHVGSEVLSMSKRIMNEVMTLAEDIDAKIYYQDTDSMHIQDEKINELSIEYKKLYNKDLIGKDLGQFHCDFDFKSDETPIAIESIFLGKKAYLDKVECINDNKINYEYHIRMKGVPSQAIKENAYQKYLNLYNGNELKVDITQYCKFKCNKNFKFSNNKEFIRTISF